MTLQIKVLCLDVDGVITDYAMCCSCRRRRTALRRLHKLIDYACCNQVRIAVVSARPVPTFFPHCSINFPKGTLFYFNPGGLWESSFKIAARKVRQIQEIAEKCNVPLSKVLFADDKKLNVDYAKSKGIQSIVIKDAINVYQVVTQKMQYQDR